MQNKEVCQSSPQKIRIKLEKKLTKVTNVLEINQRQINWDALISKKFLELQVRIVHDFKAAIINICKELRVITFKK